MIRPETRGRARALQLLYAWETTGRSVGTLVQGLSRLTGPEPAVLDFAERVAVGVSGDTAALDRELARATEHWRLDRLAVIDRNILRIAAYELLHDVPPKVVIDQALWLAHRFGTPDSPRFVNGVLDRLARDMGRL